MTDTEYSNVTLIVPQNDLESETIIQIAKKIGIRDIRITAQGWGARLEREPQKTFKDLKKRVWIVEIPGEAIEKQLEDNGHVVDCFDHHQYNGLDRSSDFSSLEQFAEIAGYTLTGEEKLVAINDRKYIWGLLEKGVPYQKIRELRRKDLEAQGWKEHDFEKSENEFFGLREKIADFLKGSRAIFMHETQLGKTGDLVDRFHLPDEQAYKFYELNAVDRSQQNILLINSGNGILKLNYSGTKYYMKLIMRKLKPFIINSWQGGQGGFGFAGMEINGRHEIDARERLKLLEKTEMDEQSHLNDKVEKFTTFFLFPFGYAPDSVKKFSDWEFGIFNVPKNENQLKSGTNDVGPWILQRNYMEYIYFHDHVRSILFQTKPENDKDPQTAPDGFRFYRFKSEDVALPLRVEIEVADGNAISAFINGIHLHLYPGHIGILSIKVSNAIETGNSQRDEDMKKYLAANPAIADSILAKASDLLLFNNLFRRIYPSYFEEGNFAEQIRNREYPESVRIYNSDGRQNSRFADLSKFDYARTFLSEYDLAKTHKPGLTPEKKLYPTLSPLMAGLLQNFQDSKKGPAYFPILDDRMLLHTYAALEEKPGLSISDEARDVYFSQLLYVDNPAEAYRYEPGFIKPLMDSFSYSRWEHYNTKIGFSRYSSAFLTFGYIDHLHRTFASMYYQMFLLIIFYRSRLIRFSDDIAALAKNFPEPAKGGVLSRDEFKKELRKLHTRFMKFMNREWFVEVTNQDQGIEIFELMRKAFSLEPMYIQVKEEIERADELIELLYREKAELFSKRVGVFGLIFGILAILTGFFGMNFAAIDDPCRWPSINWAFWSVISSIGLGIVIGLIYFFYSVLKNKNKY